MQSVLVLGGGSELAGSLVGALDGRRLRRVHLAVRDPETTDPAAWVRPDVEVVMHRYDARLPEAHDVVMRDASTRGDLDLVVVAFGVLGAPFELAAPASSSVDLVALNGAAACGAVHAAARTLESQGHGTLVVYSSVAGQRVRAENAAYGAGKAAVDGFTLAVAHRLHGSGVNVVLVRPGFVHGRMTAGRPEAPLATTPEAVAADVAAALDDDGLSVVWSPRALQVAFAGLRSLPRPLWRRIGS